MKAKGSGIGRTTEHNSAQEYYVEGAARSHFRSELEQTMLFWNIGSSQSFFRWECTHNKNTCIDK